MIHPSIKDRLGYDPDHNEKDLLKDWKNRTEDLCKPCWEIHYCPYGPIDEERRSWFTEEVESFNQEEYPERIPKVFLEASCRVFGHICPVFFVAEPLTETKTLRKHSRIIPRDVMLKVVRRDGQICQVCNQPVPDNEVEFDHIIPYSKGGRSVVENLRLLHKDCNRKKRASLTEILAENPLEHLWNLREKD